MLLTYNIEDKRERDNERNYFSKYLRKSRWRNDKGHASI